MRNQPIPESLRHQLARLDQKKALLAVQVEERARYLNALYQGHTGNLLPLQTLVAGAVERSLDLAAGAQA